MNKQKSPEIKIGSVKLQLTFDGMVNFIRFGYPDDLATEPAWFWSSTATGEQAQRLIEKYDLSPDKPQVII